MSVARLDVEDTRLIGRPITRRIVACAIAVHRELGPGLLESAYRKCLVHELAAAGLSTRQELPIPISYKDAQIDCGYRADILVEDSVLLELKAADRLLAIHDAQLLTYLRLARLRIGLLMNFNTTRLCHGLRRLVI